MISTKQTFYCKECGRKFTEVIPDCITPEIATFLLNPCCKKHRKGAKKDFLIKDKWKHMKV